MLILAMRTDKPEAELYLFENTEQLDAVSWVAHRELAETLHTRISELIKRQNKTLDDVNALLFFKGPGSFTGLRIGASVVNALSASLNIPAVGESGESWLETGLGTLFTKSVKTKQIVVPMYGSDATTTAPK